MGHASWLRAIPGHAHNIPDCESQIKKQES
jgi:hypothetical protein